MPEFMYLCDMDISKMTDRQIVEAILKRDAAVTHKYLYERCYPLFKAVYDRYYTDCNDCTELINEIYLYIMTPKRDTGESKLEKFGYRCTLTMWLKIVVTNYCHQLYERRGTAEMSTDSLDDPERYSPLASDAASDPTRRLSRRDLERMVADMPNERYRRIIRYRYIEELTAQETAQLMGMTMENYYNKHRLAKAQFEDRLRKEGLI